MDTVSLETIRKFEWSHLPSDPSSKDKQSGVQAINAGWYGACSIVNGGAWCWGRNQYGQLGNNSTTDSYVPVQVQGLASGVQAIALNRQQQNPATSSGCAVADGGVRCWRHNGSGALGNGSTTASLIPIQVTRGLGSGAVTVTVGSSAACAIVNGGANAGAVTPEAPSK